MLTHVGLQPWPALLWKVEVAEISKLHLGRNFLVRELEPAS